ncbi:MAG TPA: MarR family winged helix-turn-helix transcriptional regulator [Acidimicrobiales bacterium]|nr:MarR family winged helix-turn-helix transcriptional regulator [Acidimicrobiales bacterium]
MPGGPTIGWLMKEAVHHTRKAVDGAVRAHGVTVAQWAVLYQLAEQPGLSGAELAREMLLTPQATHQALATLGRMGLVERTPDPRHAGIHRAVLTEEGRRVADLCGADSLKIQRRILAGFDAEERKVLTGLLERYVRQARAASE